MSHHMMPHGLHRQKSPAARHRRAAVLPDQKTTGLQEESTEVQRPPLHNPDFLRKQANRIRDDLDTQVARDGPDVLHSDDVLELDDFLRGLLGSPVTVQSLRYSRIHLAIAVIAGRATRWPARLIPRCDALKEAWETQFGPLEQIGTLLYEPGGRLNGVCTADDASREKLIVKWQKDREVKISPMVSRRFGDLGFKPGDWWINSLFAFRDGIIDSAEPGLGIVADAHGTYAILMTGQDEDASPTPDALTYRARHEDRGRYRLTRGTPDSRAQVRVLRSHTLRSFWSPKAGVRYDGLHKVTGWSIRTDPHTRETVYRIMLKRLPTEPSMDTVLCRPWVEEVEDYKEYKRLRQLAREQQRVDTKPKELVKTPTLMVSTDGTRDFTENAIVHTSCDVGQVDEDDGSYSLPDTPMQEVAGLTLG